METLHSFSIKTPAGNLLDTTDYKNKVVLIVNTATQCGLTPQLVELEELHQTYSAQGLVVIGFPCNQFGGQEPLENHEMEKTCALNYGVSFQLTEKIDVNGANAHPFYQFLTQSIPGEEGQDIEWNFAKFLLNKEGLPVKRFAPSLSPLALKTEIEKLLS